MSDVVDIAIVGAGLAGLAAARRLVDAGLDVRVVEARDRLGGRTWSRIHEGATMDLGGQWIGPGQPRMYALAEELGIELFPTPVDGRQILDVGGKISDYSGTIPRVGPLHLVQLQLALTMVERAAGKVDPEHPWASADADWLDGTTVEAWVRGRVPSRKIREMLRPAVRTVFGAEPSEISLLHFAWYVSSAGGFNTLVDVEEGFQQDRVVGGAQRFAEGLASRVGPDRIGLEQPVAAVEQDDDGVTLHTRDGTVRARRVIVAAPLGLLDRIDWAPALPSLRDQLHQRCPMGATVKVFATYDEPFWRRKGLSGEAVCTDGPVSITFDNTTPGGPPQLLAFIVGRPARDWSSKPEAERRAIVTDQLATWFGDEARSPTWMLEQDWTREPWSGGCPITQFPPGTLSVFGPALREPVGRIHWAGTETATRCTGFMEGAVTSGERAADEVVAAGRD